MERDRGVEGACIIGPVTAFVGRTAVGWRGRVLSLIPGPLPHPGAGATDRVVALQIEREWITIRDGGRTAFPRGLEGGGAHASKALAFVVAGVLAGGVVASTFTPAEATHTLAHLRRQINRLENQVANLRNEVYNCERIADYQVTDPATAQPVTDTFVVYTCPTG